MVSASLLAAIALAAAPANAFTSVNNRVFNSVGVGGVPAAAVVGPLYATDDASAQALSDYMVKSHDEKLKAVKTVEDTKNSEIEALKAEIQLLKTSSALATTTPAAAAAPLANIPDSEIAAKLASYQSFMTEYIVNAQNQKLLAVKEAELKAEKKFQERLDKLFEAGGMAILDGATDAVVVVEETSFQSRNANIIAAAEAGKSRWGSAEVERAIEQAKSAPASSTTTAAVSAPPSVFDERNAQIIAAAAAGKSRWGTMEVERAQKNGVAVVATVVVEEETVPSVVTLEDRVNLGARLLGASASSAPAPPSVFEQRNAQVLAAAAAGKSRWGNMEVERAR